MKTPKDEWRAEPAEHAENQHRKGEPPLHVEAVDPDGAEEEPERECAEERLRPDEGVGVAHGGVSRVLGGAGTDGSSLTAASEVFRAAA